MTGATGFVGANLVRRLLAEGHEVHALVRPAHRPWRIEAVRSDLSLHEVAVEDDAAVGRLVEAVAPEWVFNLAAYGAYPDQTDLRQMLATNVNGTVNLVEAALRTGVHAFVHTGSSSEYGAKDHPPGETDWLEPNSHYGVTKASATLFCRFTAISRRANLTVLRLYSAYGPWEEPSRLMPTLVLAGFEGRLPPLVRPTIGRDYVYVDDVVEACLLAAQRAPTASPVYNVGTGVQTTLAEVVAVAQRVMGIKAQPEWGSMAPRSWDTDVWVAEASAIRAELGWQPRHDLEAGLSKLAAWLREHPAMQAQYRAAP